MRKKYIRSLDNYSIDNYSNAYCKKPYFIRKKKIMWKENYFVHFISTTLQQLTSSSISERWSIQFRIHISFCCHFDSSDSVHQAKQKVKGTNTVCDKHILSFSFSARLSRELQIKKSIKDQKNFCTNTFF